MKNSTHRITGGLAALAAVAILMAACAGAQPTVAPTASPTASATPTATATRTATATPTASASPTEASAALGADGYPEIALLKPFIPSAIWSTCTPATSAPSTSVQSAYCQSAGVDGVWYDLYGSAADLKAVFTADIKTAKPATTTLTCSNSNVFDTWRFANMAKNPDYGQLCYKYTDTSGKTIAVIENADPTTKVMFIASLSGGDQQTLDTWWVNTPVMIEP